MSLGELWKTFYLEPIVRMYHLFFCFPLPTFVITRGICMRIGCRFISMLTCFDCLFCMYLLFQCLSYDITVHCQRNDSDVTEVMVCRMECLLRLWETIKPFFSLGPPVVGSWWLSFSCAVKSHCVRVSALAYESQNGHSPDNFTAENQAFLVTGDHVSL